MLKLANKHECHRQCSSQTSRQTRGRGARMMQCRYTRWQGARHAHHAHAPTRLPAAPLTHGLHMPPRTRLPAARPLTHGLHLQRRQRLHGQRLQRHAHQGGEAVGVQAHMAHHARQQAEAQLQLAGHRLHYGWDPAGSAGAVGWGGGGGKGGGGRGEAVVCLGCTMPQCKRWAWGASKGAVVCGKGGEGRSGMRVHVLMIEGTGQHVQARGWGRGGGSVREDPAACSSGRAGAHLEACLAWLLRPEAAAGFMFSAGARGGGCPPACEGMWRNDACAPTPRGGGAASKPVASRVQQAPCCSNTCPRP